MSFSCDYVTDSWYTLLFCKDLRQLIKIIFSNLWFWAMVKLLIFIKDSSVSKDIYSLLPNHKLAFCDHVATGIKKVSLFQLTFLQSTSPQVEGNWIEWGIFVSFFDPFQKFKKIKTITGECFRFTQASEWRGDVQLSSRLSFWGHKTSLRDFCNFTES